MEHRAGFSLDQVRAPDGRPPVQDAGDGPEGDLDAHAGIQLDSRRDGEGGRGPRQAATPAELQGGVADDDGVPGRVAGRDPERAGPPARGDAQGDLSPPGRRPVRPRRAARQQTPAEAATLPHGTARRGAQTPEATRVMSIPSAIRLSASKISRARWNLLRNRTRCSGARWRLSRRTV